MQRIVLQNFQKILEYSHPFSVSMYVNTEEEVGLKTTTRKAQFQNLSAEVFHELDALAISETELESIMKNLEKIRTDEAFWEVGPKSLAVFISPEICEFHPLPIGVKNLAIVSYRFHIKPLIRLLANSQDFYLLSLAKNSAEFFKGDRYGLQKIEIPDMPKNQEESVGIEADDRNLQFHTSTTNSGSGNRPAQFYGSSSWKDDKHRYLERYLHEVNNAVTQYLKDDKSPLILAGVERMITTYTELNKYDYLLKDAHISGNSERSSLTELHQKSMELLVPYFIEKENEVVEKYFENGSAAKFSIDLAEILKEARLGRVDTLVVAQGERKWGQFNPDTLSVTYSNEATPNAHDLLDLACAQTLLNGGKAYVLPAEKIPQHKLAAAVFRY